MFKLNRYYESDSLIHALNPVLKLILSILFIITAFLAHSLMANLFLIAFLLIIMVSSLVPPIYYMRSIMMAKYFIILLAIMDLIFFQSLSHLIETLLPMIMTILITSVVILTTRVRMLVISLETILKPLKIFGLNPRKMAFAFMLAIRFIPILLEEARNIIKALKNRETKVKLTLIEKLKMIDKLLSPLFAKSLEHADALADVMTIRNYSFEKSPKYTFKTGSFDYTLMATELILLIGVIIKG